MDLVDDGYASARQPFDDRDLPQRLVQIERPGEDARDVIAERVVIARARQRGAAHVVREIEVRVVNPDWIADAARRPDELLAVARNQVQTLLDSPREPERSAPALHARRAFEDVRRADMERGLVALRVEEPRVDADERFEIGLCHIAPKDRIVPLLSRSCRCATVPL